MRGVKLKFKSEETRINFCMSSFRVVVITVVALVILKGVARKEKMMFATTV